MNEGGDLAAGSQENVQPAIGSLLTVGNSGSLIETTLQNVMPPVFDGSTLVDCDTKQLNGASIRELIAPGGDIAAPHDIPPESQGKVQKEIRSSVSSAAMGAEEARVQLAAPPSPIADEACARAAWQPDQVRPSQGKRPSLATASTDSALQTQKSDKAIVDVLSATWPESLSPQGHEAEKVHGRKAVHTVVGPPGEHSAAMHVASQTAPSFAIESGVNFPKSTDLNSKDLRRFEPKTAAEGKAGRENVRQDETHQRSEADSPSRSDESSNGSVAFLKSVENRTQVTSAEFGLISRTPDQTHTSIRQQVAPGNGSTSDSLNSTQPPRDGVLETETADSILPAGAVSNARLIEHLKESQINLNVRSADFGNVSIHTAIDREQLSAQISLERNDLGKALATEAEALQSKLSQEHGIRTTIQVQQQTSSFAGNSGYSQNYAPRSQPPSSSSAVRVESQEVATIAMPVVEAGRLDIRV
jgi:hypothetical protein